MGANRKSARQKQINSDWQWNQMLEKQGLTVVDVYSEWCGPCAAMKPNLQKLQRELPEHKFHLAIAKSDKITYLQQFKNRSEPTWMILVDGKIVNVMYGANAPKLMRLITAELKKEAAVKAGTRERVELEMTDLLSEEKEQEEIVEKVPEFKEMRNVVVEGEEFMYRPF